MGCGASVDGSRPIAAQPGTLPPERMRNPVEGNEAFDTTTVRCMQQQTSLLSGPTAPSHTPRHQHPGEQRHTCGTGVHSTHATTDGMARSATVSLLVACCDCPRDHQVVILWICNQWSQSESWKNDRQCGVLTFRQEAAIRSSTSHCRERCLYNHPFSEASLKSTNCPGCVSQRPYIMQRLVWPVVGVSA